MLLSFSHPAMLPYLRDGIRQAQGEDVGAARVKRQTIRRRGTRALRMLAWARDAHWTHPYDLHLWWRARSAEREHLGTIAGGGRLYPITILHSFVEEPSGARWPVLRLDGPEGWREGAAMLFWSPGDVDGDFAAEARADGFDKVEDFRDYFVPNMGDRFEAVIFKW